MNGPDESANSQRGPILIGLVFIFLGLVVLADRVGLSGIHLSGRYWPLLLIIFGSVRLMAVADQRDGGRRSRWTAAWFIYLGLWFLVNEFHVFGLRYDTSWPLLIVWVGVRMMSCAILNGGRRPHQRIEES
jgi:hypothetical protein